MKFISRITVATIFTEAIDSAVPRNSDVISRLAGIGQHGVGQRLAERDAADERHHDAGDGGGERGASALAHQLEVGLHAGEQQQHQDAELRHRIEHRLLLFGGGEQGVLEIREEGAQHRGAEHQAGDQLAHHRRLAEAQHGLAEQAADQHQHDELGDEHELGGALDVCRSRPGPVPAGQTAAAAIQGQRWSGLGQDLGFGFGI